MLVGILSLLRGFMLGLSRSHARSHSAVSVPVFRTWILSGYMFRALLLAVLCIRYNLPHSFGLWSEDSGTLKISPRHRYHDIAVFN